jgi:hypothetical protein
VLAHRRQQLLLRQGVQVLLLARGQLRQAQQRADVAARLQHLPQRQPPGLLALPLRLRPSSALQLACRRGLRARRPAGQLLQEGQRRLQGGLARRLCFCGAAQPPAAPAARRRLPKPVAPPLQLLLAPDGRRRLRVGRQQVPAGLGAAGGGRRGARVRRRQLLWRRQRRPATAGEQLIAIVIVRRPLLLRLLFAACRHARAAASRRAAGGGVDWEVGAVTRAGHCQPAGSMGGLPFSSQHQQTGSAGS